MVELLCSDLPGFWLFLETKRAKYEQETDKAYNNKANKEENNGVKEEVYRAGRTGSCFRPLGHPVL